MSRQKADIELSRRIAAMEQTIQKSKKMFVLWTIVVFLGAISSIVLVIKVLLHG